MLTVDDSSVEGAAFFLKIPGEIDFGNSSRNLFPAGSQNFMTLRGEILKTSVSFLKYFIYLFLDRGEVREKEMDRNIHVWLPLARPSPGNLAHNPGMCPYWELNQ